MAINLKNGHTPKGWEVCSLPDFTRIVMGQSPPSTTYNHTGQGIPFFQGKAEFGEIYPRIDKYCSQPTKIAEAGATLLTVRAPVGPTNLTPQKCCIGRGLAAIHPCCKIDKKYILFLMRSIEPDISDKGTGSTFTAINKTFIEELEFGLPPLDEQFRIVAKIEELFSELNNGIESLKTAREQLKIYRQAVLKHAFEGKLTAQWRKENKDRLETADQLLARIRAERESRYQQQLQEWKTAVDEWEAVGKEGKKPPKPKKPPELEPIISDDLPPLPGGWVWLYVADVLELAPTNGRSVRDRSDGFPVLRLTALRGGKLDLSENKRGDWSREEAAPFLVCEGDFLLSRGNGSKHLVGQGRLAASPVMEVAFPDTMIRLRVNARIIRPNLFSLLWNSRTIRSQIESAAHTTAGIYKINQGHINGFAIPVTCMFEQSLIIERLEETISRVDALALDIDQRLTSSEALRQSILKKAFSGQLVEQDPNDEPASVLLERIKTEKAEQEKNNKKNKRRNAA